MHEERGRFLSGPYDEFKFSGGALVMYNHPDPGKQGGGRVEVRYDDGAVLVLWEPPTLEGRAAHDNLIAAKQVCQRTPALSCPNIEYQGRYYGLASLDGANFMDAEIWNLVDFNADENNIRYQACHNGNFYSAPDSKTLMDVVDKLDSDPAAAKSDPAVKKYLVTDDALLRRLPVCDWRHRIGFDAVSPAPKQAVQIKFIPASHARLAYVEVKRGKTSVEVFVDEDNRRLDHILTRSGRNSFSFTPDYNGPDCPTFDRCEHAFGGPEAKPDRFDLRSLDDEPLSQSRIFAVLDTVNGAKYYDGCAGGRLYSGKNRAEVEGEVKVALENPAPPPVKGAPIFGSPETAESGDLVLPDAMCDWAFRRQQAELLMKNSQPAPTEPMVPGARR